MNELPTDDLHFKVSAWANRAMDEGIDPVALYQAMAVVALDIQLQMLPVGIVSEILRETADMLERREHIPLSSERH